jgi:hypothetical protein
LHPPVFGILNISIISEKLEGAMVRGLKSGEAIRQLKGGAKLRVYIFESGGKGIKGCEFREFGLV